MAIKDMSEQELAKTLAEVGKELESLLKSETERLAKSATAPESTPPAEETAAAAPSDSGGGAPPAPPADAPPADAGTAAPPVDPSAAPPADGAEQGAPDFSQVSDEELKQMYLHIRQELLSRMSQGQDAAGAVPPDAGNAPPPAPPQAPPGPPVAKAELEKSVIAKAEKQEQEIAELRKALAEQQKQIELTATVVSKVLTRPSRKAITDSTALAKAEEPKKDVKKLPKKEVLSLLKPMVENTTLEKSDREAINAYAFGTAGFEAIEHLFNKK